ncbi:MULTISPECIES: glutaredoxin family protein [Corallincola]|uniref:Glutaredoxin family protein n=3 Tax=Corallincola TaxID=1775176 RepID=A0A368NQ52_9GAMM|nr:MULTISPECIES: glutaredoxin family protein [Corallincola]RCU52672.1 glutaredoxin family protein [Corallincola holothuriorum]TAA48148.1 glutaredoxin family protein [Corallincola spongiicola]TCI03171.1 glutaredoxin family protein [Corallincola luteus]
MIEAILYSTDGCHLCQEAQQLLAPLVDNGMQLRVVDIMDNDDDLQRFRIRIPVLALNHSIELDWPFDIQRVQHSIESIS